MMEHAQLLKEYARHPFFFNEQNVAEIYVPYDTIRHLELTVRIDGFADHC